MIARRHKLYIAAAAIAATGIAISSCAPKPDPTPTPPPTTVKPTTPPTAPPPTPSNWMDQPRTPGTWAYRPGTGVSLATYGMPGRDPVFAAQCDRRTGTVSLLRATRQNTRSAMRILTETQKKVLTGEPARTGYPALSAPVAGRDSLLDAMAFTKGRFAVEVNGEATVYIPSWTEFSRIVEDCR